MFVVYAAMFTIRPWEIRTAALLRERLLKICPLAGRVLFAGRLRRNLPRNKNDDIVKSPYASLRFIPPRLSPGQTYCDVHKKYDSFLGIYALCLWEIFPMSSKVAIF